MTLEKRVEVSGTHDVLKLNVDRYYIRFLFENIFWTHLVIFCQQKLLFGDTISRFGYRERRENGELSDHLAFFVLYLIAQVTRLYGDSGCSLKCCIVYVISQTISHG